MKKKIALLVMSVLVWNVAHAVGARFDGLSEDGRLFYLCSEPIPLNNGYQNRLNNIFETSVAFAAIPEQVPISRWTVTTFADEGLALVSTRTNDKQTHYITVNQLVSQYRVDKVARLITEVEGTYDLYFTALPEQHVGQRIMKTEVASLEELRALWPASQWLSLFHAGGIIFTTPAYAIWLPRSVDFAVVCLPRSKQGPNRLEGGEVRKALFDFLVKSNSMKFLGCEDVLVRPAPTQT